MSARRRPSRRKDYDSVGDQEREEPSTPIRETSTVADQRKTEETMGGDEELETDAEVGSTADEHNTKHALPAGGGPRYKHAPGGATTSDRC